MPRLLGGVLTAYHWDKPTRPFHFSILIPPTAEPRGLIWGGGHRVGREAILCPEKSQTLSSARARPAPLHQGSRTGLCGHPISCLCAFYNSGPSAWQALPALCNISSNGLPQRPACRGTEALSSSSHCPVAAGAPLTSSAHPNALSSRAHSPLTSVTRLGAALVVHVYDSSVPSEGVNTPRWPLRILTLSQALLACESSQQPHVVIYAHFTDEETKAQRERNLPKVTGPGSGCNAKQAIWLQSSYPLGYEDSK